MHLSMYLSIYLSIYLFIYLSIHLGEASDLNSCHSNMTFNTRAIKKSPVVASMIMQKVVCLQLYIDYFRMPNAYLQDSFYTKDFANALSLLYKEGLLVEKTILYFPINALKEFGLNCQFMEQLLKEYQFYYSIADSTLLSSTSKVLINHLILGIVYIYLSI